MPRYVIGGSYGYAGTDWSDEVEAGTIEEAQEMAFDRAVERVDSWAKPIEDNSDDKA